MQLSEPAVGIRRANLSEDVAFAVRDMIVDGRLAEGARINEVHLAASLGVSRTPLREALARLSAEGALTAKPNLGYFVCALSLEEMRQIYPMRALLDPEALRLAGLPSKRHLERLESLNDKIDAARTPKDVLHRDDEWHIALIENCPNRVLLDLIEQFMRRTRRYELVLMRERRNVKRAVTDHSGILACLRAGDLEGACAALKQNMHGGTSVVEDWLRERTSKNGNGDA